MPSSKLLIIILNCNHFSYTFCSPLFHSSLPSVFKIPFLFLHIFKFEKMCISLVSIVIPLQRILIGRCEDTFKMEGSAKDVMFCNWHPSRPLHGILCRNIVFWYYFRWPGHSPSPLARVVTQVCMTATRGPTKKKRVPSLGSPTLTNSE